MLRRAWVLVVVLGTLFAASAGATSVSDAKKIIDEESCRRLVSFHLAGGHIEGVDWIGDASDLEPHLPAAYHPAFAGPFCRVVAVLTPTADSRIGVELWLPVLHRWNGKFKGVGSGGLGGQIPYEALVKGVGQGYAVAATDTGHDDSAPAGSFALSHPEKIADYGFRAIHLTALRGKEVTTAYYHSPVKHAYFEGCSQGGNEALMEAQRYPGDYDGIVAGDPDYNQTHHEVGVHLWVVSTLYSDPRSHITSVQAQLIGDAVNAACDDLDGVKDGVLEDPRRCKFDPAVLQCQDEGAKSCLTAEQVAAVRQLWEGPARAIEPTYYPGLERGGEAALWAGWIEADTADENVHGSLGLPFFRYFVFNDANWNFGTFVYRRDPPEVERRLATVINATSPNLLPFARRGGKIIHFHGFNDPDVPPQASIQYYEQVSRTLARKRPPVADFYSLFMVPGMGHCGGGPGANTFDMMPALEQWVEHGIAPKRIVATKYVNEDSPQPVQRTHPLCPYPESAHFIGGDADDEKQFVCTR